HLVEAMESHVPTNGDAPACARAAKRMLQAATVRAPRDCFPSRPRNRATQRIRGLVENPTRLPWRDAVSKALAERAVDSVLFCVTAPARLEPRADTRAVRERYMQACGV